MVKGMDEGNLIEVFAIELAKRSDAEQVRFFDAFIKELYSEGSSRGELQLATVVRAVTSKTKEALFAGGWDG